MSPSRDHVVLALDPHLARLLGGVHRARRHQLVVADHLGADEPAFEVGVDHAGRLGRLRAAADLPGAGLVLPGREERDQVERAVARARSRSRARARGPRTRPGAPAPLRRPSPPSPPRSRRTRRPLPPESLGHLRALLEVRDDDRRLERERRDRLELAAVLARRARRPRAGSRPCRAVVRGGERVDLGGRLALRPLLGLLERRLDHGLRSASSRSARTSATSDAGFASGPKHRTTIASASASRSFAIPCALRPSHPGRRRTRPARGRSCATAPSRSGRRRGGRGRGRPRGSPAPRDRRSA